MSFQAPPDWMLENFIDVYRWFLLRLQVLMAVDPELEFTSWYRTEADNRTIGGNPDSQHLYGFAVDVVPRNFQLIEQVANGLGMIAVVEMDHLHIQILPPGTLRSLGFFSIAV